MKTILVLGNDKISGDISKLIHPNKNLYVYIDKSSDFKRVFKLLRRGSLGLSLLIKMIICEFKRTGSKPSSALPTIQNNNDLLKLMNDLNPERILLFRAGLIINKKIINLGIPVNNIHAAKVPDFGGIGSINNAIKSQEYNQFASLHTVTTTIDKGELLDYEEFTLNPKINYCQNETVAYESAKKLLLRTIENNITL